MGLTYNVANNGIVTLTNDLVVDINVLKVDTTGNFVGINKTTPAVALDVVGAITATGTITGNLFAGSGASLTSIPESGITNLVSDLALKAADSLVVHLAGTEIITGVKTFNAAGTAVTISNNASLGTLGIGTAAPVASALLEMVSTAKGFLGPRMTTTQRDAISTPATGLLVYNTTTNAYNVYNGTSWVAVGSGGGSIVEIRQSFTATGGQTVFTLSTAYTMGGTNLRVYRNGQLVNPGAGNDYVETSTTVFTMLNGQTAGDLITAQYVVSSGSILATSPGTQYRQTFSAAGGAQQFTLSNAYLNNGTNLEVFVNGALQRPSTHYSEDNTTQFTIASGLTSGDSVVARWTSAATGVTSFTPATEIRQDFIGDGVTTTFALTGGATFIQGGANLKVSVDGVLNRLGGANDYTEPSNSQITFTAGNIPTSGQTVTLIAITNTGALGSFQNRRTELVATAGQTTFSADFTFVMGGADMLLYYNGQLMKLGDDYYELDNTQVVFYTGRVLNGKVTFIGKIQAASGDANSVNGISASITPTANKLVPLDGAGLLPVATLGGAWTTHTPTFTGFSANPTFTTSSYIKFGKTVIWNFTLNVNGTSNATTFTMTLPFTSSSQRQMGRTAAATDNGTNYEGAFYVIEPGATVVSLFRTYAANAWTASGLKGISGQFIYEAA